MEKRNILYLIFVGIVMGCYLTMVWSRLAPSPSFDGIVTFWDCFLITLVFFVWFAMGWELKRIFQVSRLDKEMEEIACSDEQKVEELRQEALDND